MCVPLIEGHDRRGRVVDRLSPGRRQPGPSIAMQARPAACRTVDAVAAVIPKAVRVRPFPLSQRKREGQLAIFHSHLYLHLPCGSIGVSQTTKALIEVNLSLINDCETTLTDIINCIPVQECRSCRDNRYARLWSPRYQM